MKNMAASFKTCAVLFLAAFLLSSCAAPHFSTPFFDQQAEVSQWLQSLAGKKPAEQARLAEQVWSNASASRSMRQRAAYILATRPGSQSGIAQSSLAALYMNSSPQQRVSMEQTLFADLNTTDAQTLTSLARAVTSAQERQFPYSLTLWAAAKRNLVPDSAAVVSRLSAPGVFSDPSITGASAFPTVTSATSGCVALLLPKSGSASTVAAQIAKGADAARLELQNQGKMWEIISIDTDAPDWISRVNSLPATCVSVGGPIQVQRLTQALDAGISKNRAIFAFLPRLPNVADEGVRAWRFFTSPEDQINAMLDVAFNDMAITQFGVFAPDDKYGQGMASLFREMAIRRGFGVTMGQYPAKEVKEWVKASAGFVNYRKPEKGGIPKINVPFEAIFLPDSWKNMDMVISTLHYHGAHKKIMLGTALWEQGISRAAGLNPGTFALSVFPAAFDDKRVSPSVQSLMNGLASQNAQPDDWAVLGYDFIKAAAALGLSSQPNAAAVNRALSALHADYAGAPITWDAQGKASRKLFLMQPARNGKVPYDTDKFRQYRNVPKSPMPNQDFDSLNETERKAADEAALKAVDQLANDLAGGM